MIVTERAAGRGIDWRMPRGIAFVIGADDRIGVVLGGGAVVVRAGRSDTESNGIACGGTVVGRRRTVVTGKQHNHWKNKRAFHAHNH